MLDRERADFYRTLAAAAGAALRPLRRDPAPDRQRARADAAIVDLLHNCAYMDPGGAREGDPVPIPDEMAETRGRVPREAARRRRRDRRGADGDATSAARSSTRPRSRRRSRARSPTDELYPVACGVATKNLGTHALLDLLVEGVPSPVRKAHDRDRHEAAAPPPSSSRRSPTRSPGGSRASASTAAPSPPTRRSSTCATRRRSGSAG